MQEMDLIGSVEECWCKPYQRYRNVRVPVGDGESYTKIEWCLCPDGQEEKRTHDENERRVRRQKIEARRDQVIATCRIPIRFWDFTLDGSPLAKTSPELVRQMSDDADEANGSWYLWGTHGIGKTGLAIGYAKSVMCLEDPDRYPTSVLYMPVPDLFTGLRATYNGSSDRTEAEVMGECRHADLLILDDIGTEKPSEWTADRLYQIVNARHGEEQPIIFTSNLSVPALAKRIGERTAWRIVEMCGDDHIVHVEGLNLRDTKTRRVTDSTNASHEQK